MTPSTLDRPVRAGLIGFGYAGRTFHAPLLQTTPGLDLVAVSSSQGATAAAALSQPGACAVDVLPTPEALLAREDIELVVIATPNASHAPLAEAALRAGKAVVVDKPFALSAEQAEALVRLADEQQRLLSVFHNRRWDGDFLTVQALLQDSAKPLGRLVQMEACFDRFRPQVRERWREQADSGGGIWLDLAPHLLDQALQLFGAPVALQADIASLRDGAQADDWFRCQLRYASGLRVGLQASTLAALPGPRFALHGTRVSYRKAGLDLQEDALKAGLRPDPADPAAWGADPNDGQLMLQTDGDVDLQALPLITQPGRYPAYYAGVRDALRGRGPNPVSARSALAVMRLLDVGRDSARQQRELPCPPDLETLLEP